MKAWKKILLAVAAFLVIFVLIGFLLPRQVHVERSVEIQAPPEVVFDWVNHLKRSEKWSPWVAMEKTAQLDYSGPESGVGSTSTWKGEVIGEGSQEITESDRPKQIKVTLDFRKNGTAAAYYRFDPIGQGTRVTWGFDTDMGVNPVARYFGLMMNRMMGPEFEKGLSSLKKVSEEEAASRNGDFRNSETPEAKSEAASR